MKLIIQIPCFNEEESLPVTLSNLPRELEGIDSVEWLIIDDGSTDNTSKIAKELGVDHIIRHKNNKGIAKAFMTGIKSCLQLGADIIVNTDADNQYDASSIKDLIKPVLEEKADACVGIRPLKDIAHFSSIKKFLQIFGSKVVGKIGNINIDDATSGFKAFNREAALQLNIFGRYGYCVENVVQMGLNNMAVSFVPIGVNPYLRPSRLIKSIPYFIIRSITIAIRTYITYNPFKFMSRLGFILLFLGLLAEIQCLLMSNCYNHNIYMFLLGLTLLAVGFLTIIAAIIVDLLSVNRKILENIQIRARKNDIL